jgi:hypothetical protein
MLPYFRGMKRLLMPLLACLLLTAACESRKPTDATQTADTATIQPTDATAATALPTRLQPLGLTPGHDWQTVSLGDGFAALNVPGERFEADATHVGHSVEFNDYESVDSQFFQQHGKVSRIQADFYLNTAKAVADFRQDLTTYLTARFGAPTTNGPATTWQNGKVKLTDVSKAKDFGLKLIIGEM